MVAQHPVRRIQVRNIKGRSNALALGIAECLSGWAVGASLGLKIEDGLRRTLFACGFTGEDEGFVGRTVRDVVFTCDLEPVGLVLFNCEVAKDPVGGLEVANILGLRYICENIVGLGKRGELVGEGGRGGEGEEGEEDEEGEGKLRLHEMVSQ